MGNQYTCWCSYSTKLSLSTFYITGTKVSGFLLKTILFKLCLLAVLVVVAEQASLVVADSGFSRCGAWVARGGFSCRRGSGHAGCSSRGAWAQQSWLLGSSAQASLPHGVWGLPRSGIPPQSLALAGWCFTIELPGKPRVPFLGFFFKPLHKTWRAGLRVLFIWGRLLMQCAFSCQ